jgi:Spy/CpxP family protein refolding chaperone
MKERFKFWLVLSLILAFAAGLVCGIFVDKYVLSKRSDGEGRRGPHPPSLEFLSKQLGLSPQQQEQIKEIFRKNEERMKELRTRIHGDLNEVRSQLKDEIDRVITPEQKEKLEAIIKKHIDEQRKNDKDRGKGEEE